MEPSRPIPPSVRTALDVWLGHHAAAAPGLIEGLYLVGSVALDDWQPDSDIDIIAFTASVPSDTEVAALRAAHDATVAELGDVDIDGPRLAWPDVADPPTTLVRPWTLHGEFHHDDGCFELNPAMWHTLGRHGLVVQGPDPEHLAIHLDRRELHRFVVRNTDTYWRSIADAVAAAAADPDRTSFKPEMTAWAVLGVARMLNTARTGSIVSKTSAGEWIVGELPEYAGLVAHSLAIRRGAATRPDTRETARETAGFVRTVVDLVVAENDPTRAGDD